MKMETWELKIAESWNASEKIYGENLKYRAHGVHRSCVAASLSLRCELLFFRCSEIPRFFLRIYAKVDEKMNVEKKCFLANILNKNTKKRLTKFCWNIEVWAGQKHVNLVDLVKSFPTNIFLQNLASIQQRTSLIKFDDLDEKSE